MIRIYVKNEKIEKQQNKVDEITTTKEIKKCRFSSDTKIKFVELEDHSTISNLRPSSGVGKEKSRNFFIVEFWYKMKNFSYHPIILQIIPSFPKRFGNIEDMFICKDSYAHNFSIYMRSTIPNGNVFRNRRIDVISIKSF